jgi:hypothetical protein
MLVDSCDIKSSPGQNTDIDQIAIKIIFFSPGHGQEDRAW